MDIILYNILIGFCCLFIGYLFGSIPIGVIIGKIFFHRDPRLEGSKNSGGTNVGRLFGKKVGFIVIILDMLKSIIPTVCVFLILKYSSLENLLLDNFGQGFFDNGILFTYLTPVGVSIGHCWPLFAKFKGGKTVSVFVGFCALSSWSLIVLGIIVFFLTLKITKFVSLSSILMTVSFIAFLWLMFGLSFVMPENSENIIMWGNGNFLKFGWEFSSAVTFIGLTLIYRHKANIGRLFTKTENKIKWLK